MMSICVDSVSGELHQCQVDAMDQHFATWSAAGSRTLLRIVG